MRSVTITFDEPTDSYAVSFSKQSSSTERAKYFIGTYDEIPLKDIQQWFCGVHPKNVQPLIT